MDILHAIINIVTLTIVILFLLCVVYFTLSIIYDFICYLIVNKSICPICHKEVSDVKVGCGHVFHHTCILKWKEIDNSCPTCRINNFIDLEKSNVETLI